MFFSRRCRRRLRRRWRRVDRVSPAPKLLLVVLGVRSVLPPCVKVYGLRAVMLEPYEGLYKTLCCNISETRISVPFLLSVRISYWSRNWYGKYSGSQKRGPTACFLDHSWNWRRISPGIFSRLDVMLLSAIMWLKSPAIAADAFCTDRSLNRTDLCLNSFSKQWLAL